MGNLKIGIFGAGRGAKYLGRDFLRNGCDVVAICDNRKERVEAILQYYDNTTTIYENFDEFLNHDMDAVVLANSFHEHAPYAIKCFERGLHVFSECISNGTMAEGVELIRAFEKSNSIYLLGENYPFMTFNREIKKICDGGTLGKIMYAEGEYNHPGNPMSGGSLEYNYYRKHWRNFAPRSYYLTHSLGPIMWATGATPTKVSCFNVFAPVPKDAPSAKYNGDRVSIITTQNDDGSVFRFTGCANFGGTEYNSYRVCGLDGFIETPRGIGGVVLRYNDWSVPEGGKNWQHYEPEFEDMPEEIRQVSGHGGSDHILVKYFVDCVKNNRQPEHPFDIYSAVTMSSVGILAHRAMLEEKVYQIPDFHKEECRKQYENDRLTPFYGEDGSEPNIPCCSVPDYKPTEKQLELYDKRGKSE